MASEPHTRARLWTAPLGASPSQRLAAPAMSALLSRADVAQSLYCSILQSQAALGNCRWGSMTNLFATPASKDL